MRAQEHRNGLTRLAVLASCLAVLTSAAWLAHGADAEPRRPAMTEEDPAPGKFVRQVAEEYRGTGVYHGLYLPANWKPGGNYPLIVEYAPNRSPPFTGRVEDCRMGFYQSGGRDFIWVVMPYIDSATKANLDQWWGDEEAAVQYCATNLARICEKFGGDPSAVFLTGFSRGAIACGYLGLRDEAIADVWLAFLPHSHIDGGRYTTKGAAERLARARGRATFVTYGGADNARKESPKGARMLRELGFPVVEREIAGLVHTDAFVEQDSPIRREMREWIAEILKTRPGTHTVRGRVIDSAGKGVAGVRVRCGSWHYAVTDAEGRYAIPSLVAGTRKLLPEKAGLAFTPAQREIAVEQQDVEAEPFKSP